MVPIKKTVFTILLISCLTCLYACEEISNKQKTLNVDTLITNGKVYTGESLEYQALDIAICGSDICGVYPKGEHSVNATITLDAKNKIVSPGFIDPHTHTLEELYSKDKNHNLNYLTQGVTTVVNGNDGEGPVDIEITARELEANGIGTNVALLVGHASIREQVMGLAQRYATAQELEKMSQLLIKAMQAGAIGLSTGLYYVPGSFANTEEVIMLAKIASKYNGIYDTHLRDESTFNIGFIAALDEAIHIAESANIHLHLAHIKALGVDVWGQSTTAIEKIEQAQSQGISISADQYPWLASGTKLRSALMPKWAMADSQQAFHQRLNDANLADKLRDEIKENIRRRGGAESLLITAFHNSELVGLNLAEAAKIMAIDPVSAAIKLVQEGEVRVASFNMSATDLEAFMVQPWVVTSSDGTNGHPRKFASFPQKYQEYVKNKKLITVGSFINNSTSQTAKILGLNNRGQIKQGFKADIIVFDENGFSVNADFSTWNKYSSGIEQVWLNGQHVIKDKQFQNMLAGKFVH